MKELIGKTINKIFINNDQSILVFETTDNDLIYETEGDCCSETWFADIVGVQTIIGATVRKIENIELESVIDGRTRQEEDQFYGVKIITINGFCNIIYRNSSNGYYGGSINLFNYPRPTGLIELTDDWSA